jgi:cyanophycinase
MTDIGTGCTPTARSAILSFMIRGTRESHSTFALVALSVGICFGQQSVAPEYGPPNGTLIIVGGGNLTGTGLMETFISRAGGPAAKIIVVPTAGGNKERDGKWTVYKEEQIIGPWVKLGATNVHMLHTHDPKEADTEAFASTLRDANAVWFNGGRQWNCVDSYSNTLTEREFHNVLARGGVIGGSSAGATIQGDFLVRGAISGAEVVIATEPEHQHGFAFLRKSAIDQHINTRLRWDDLAPVLKKYPDFLGIGLSEGTAIIVNKDTFEVMGKWKVAVWDNTHPRQPWEKPFFVLSTGDVYNMKTRSIEKYGIGDQKPVTVGAKN